MYLLFTQFEGRTFYCHKQFLQLKILLAYNKVLFSERSENGSRTDIRSFYGKTKFYIELKAINLFISIFYFYHTKAVSIDIIISIHNNRHTQ